MKVFRFRGLMAVTWGQRLQNLQINKRSKQLSIQSHNFSSNQSDVYTQIKRHTELTRDHLTPEIQLNLVTPNCELWHSRGDNSPFSEPFWAFYWPGGQAVTRYILDHFTSVRGMRVLDVGCGCGASSIAAAMCGASVTANDIDKVAISATELNASMNGCNITTNSSNLIGSYCDQWDVIILGDMFYESGFADLISDWLRKYLKKETVVLIGDPGRLTFMNHPMKSQLTKLIEYDLPDRFRMENNGLTSACVWTLCGL